MGDTRHRLARQRGRRPVAGAAHGPARRGREARRPNRGLPPLTLRFTALTALGVVFLVAVALALATPGDVLKNLGRNLLTTLAVALLAYLWFYFWTSYNATNRLRRQARTRPEWLFPVAPRIGRASYVFGRDGLIEEIDRATREPDVRPQLIVGDTGSGKTSLLLALADHFARRRGVIPIVVSLRDAHDLDFSTIAKARFKEYVDPYVRADADVEKLWRWVLRRRAVVLLADDLDRARVPGLEQDPYKMDARVALEAAARRELPIVVTTRSEGLPPCVSVDVKPLGELELSAEDAVAELERQLGMRGSSAAMRACIERGKLTVNPFYLGVLANLMRLHVLRAPVSFNECVVRGELMRSWYEALLGGDTVALAERTRRQEMLTLVSDYAAAMLAPKHSYATEALSGKQLQALHAAEQLDLLEIDEEGVHRFKHDAMHAYFAARTLKRGQTPLLRALEEDPDAPRVQLALIFAAGLDRDDAFCRHACETLLADSDLADERRLLRAGAALEIARSGGFHCLNEQIAATCVDARRYSAPLVRRAVLAQLAKLSGRRAVIALWEFSGDEDYDVRWAASEALMARCTETQLEPGDLSPAEFISGADAYRALVPHIERYLAGAEKLTEPRDDWAPEILALKHLAWVLPTLRTGMRALQDEEMDALVAGHLTRLIALEARPVTNQKGFEASLAQGFKADAQRNRTGGVDADACELLGRAGFWYSKLNLIQAITIRAASGDGLPGSASTISDLLRKLDRDPHPFLRVTAELCDEGLRAAVRSGEQTPVDRYVWEDEGKLASSAPEGLADDAIQLVGELLVLLNMNEASDEAGREAFGTRKTLPYCLTASTQRSELLDGCVGGEQCGFGLCPYRPALNRLSAHREISRAFCRHQQRTARARIARRWGSQVSQRALRDFWRDMESKALY